MQKPKFKVGQVVYDRRGDDLFVLITDFTPGGHCSSCGHTKTVCYTTVANNEEETDVPESNLVALTSRQKGKA